MDKGTPSVKATPGSLLQSPPFFLAGDTLVIIPILSSWLESQQRLNLAGAVLTWDNLMNPDFFCSFVLHQFKIASLSLTSLNH